jgi:hypothetical protein
VLLGLRMLEAARVGPARIVVGEEATVVLLLLLRHRYLPAKRICGPWRRAKALGRSFAHVHVSCMAVQGMVRRPRPHWLRAGTQFVVLARGGPAQSGPPTGRPPRKARVGARRALAAPGRDGWLPHGCRLPRLFFPLALGTHGGIAGGRERLRGGVLQRCPLSAEALLLLRAVMLRRGWRRLRAS